MWRRTVSEIFYNVAGYVQVVAGVLVLLISAALRAPVDQWSQRSPMLGALLAVMQETAWFFLALLIAVAGAAGLLRKYTSPPWVWALIENMLTQFREDVFTNPRDSEVHFHRVTLFKWVRWRPCWPPKGMFQGWLVPVARSGHTTRSKIARFRAPRDDPDRAEGIAGESWAKDGVVLIPELPDLGTDSSAETHDTYAKVTRVSVEWLSKKRPLARSYAGFPVEVNGRPWGVVVLDGRSIKGIDEDVFRNRYRMLARFLGQLLERTGR